MTNILVTDRLILRPLTLDDANTAYQGWTSREYLLNL